MVRNIWKSVPLITLMIGWSIFAKADPFCQSVIDGGVTVNNYTAFTPPINRNLASTDPTAYQQALQAGIPKFNQFYGKYYTDPNHPFTKKAAREVLTSLYDKTWLDSLYLDPNNASTTWIKDPACKKNAESNLESAPNVYIYVGGFGGQVTLDNTYIDAATVVQWVNQKDPNALFISLGWGCDTAAATGRKWCLQKKLDYDPPKWKVGLPYFASAPEWDRMYATTLKTGQTIKGGLTQLDAAGDLNNGQYNKSLAHGLEMAANLVNIILAADIGEIHFIGYSLGAHMVSEILTFDQDLTGGADPQKDGFPWSTGGVCKDGSQKCRIAYLKKVGWNVAWGLPGWSPALRYSYNGFQNAPVTLADASGNPQLHYVATAARDPNDRRLYENGGLFRVADVTYDALLARTDAAGNPTSILQIGRRVTFNNKLTAFNKRFDPTAISDDSYQRGVNDVVFDDYNHYGHDYNRPYFWSPAWVSMIEKYTQAVAPKPLEDWGVIWENMNYDFEDCGVGACNPKGIYAVHQSLSSHYDLVPMQSVDAVNIVQVAGPIRGTQSKALSVSDNDKPLQTYTMDQEDLRGGVEFSWQPSFDLADGKMHGIFSYGATTGSTADLMPEAYVDGTGNLIFNISYQGAKYSTEVAQSDLSSLVSKGRWAQLSFNWQLPTVDLRDEVQTADAMQKYGVLIPIANGLFRNPRSSMKRQLGAGSMTIWINGKKTISAPLGTPASERDCLLYNSQIQPDGSILPGVIAGENFTLFNNTFTYGPYNPYRLYDANNSSGAGANLGTLCKAYSIRNTPVYIGVAQGHNANALFDNLRLIFGEGREKFPEVNGDGSLKAWEDIADVQ